MLGCWEVGLSCDSQILISASLQLALTLCPSHRLEFKPFRTDGLYVTCYEKRDRLG